MSLGIEETKPKEGEDAGSTDTSTEATLVAAPITISFMFSTIFVLPGLTLLFIILEFKLFKGRLNKYFDFFESPICKGVFWLLIALMLLDRITASMIIFVSVIFAGALADLVLGSVILAREEFSLRERIKELEREADEEDKQAKIATIMHDLEA